MQILIKLNIVKRLKRSYEMYNVKDLFKIAINSGHFEGFLDQKKRFAYPLGG